MRTNQSNGVILGCIDSEAELTVLGATKVHQEVISERTEHCFDLYADCSGNTQKHTKLPNLDIDSVSQSCTLMNSIELQTY